MSPETKPLIESKLWEKAFGMNGVLAEAITNPNTDFMTKLLFDARFFAKKNGREIAYWSNTIFAIKMLLHEKKAATAVQISKGLNVGGKELNELLAYLKNMSEIIEGKGKYSLNYSNAFSKVFKE